MAKETTDNVKLLTKGDRLQLTHKALAVRQMFDDFLGVLDAYEDDERITDQGLLDVAKDIMCEARVCLYAGVLQVISVRHLGR